jgi:UPF0176 protein
MTQYVVSALYRFVQLDNYQALQQPLLDLMKANGIKGTLLLASEGINGTVAGSREAIDTLLSWLKADNRLQDLSHKESYSDELPFYRSKVKLKKEIVTMGVEGIAPRETVGTYVKPSDWNALIADPQTLLIDTRNDYEVAIGSFKNAVNPGTQSFREFPGYVKENLDPATHKKVAMFCTGGIRCEKSTAYLKQQGFEEVYHLEGGILKYLQEVEEESSLWEGECFVFDNRVAVNHALQKGQYDQCYACRYPITEEEKSSEQYVPGVSCPHCYDKLTVEQRERFAEREKQLQLSRSRGEAHIGSDITAVQMEKRKQKRQFKHQQRLSSSAGSETETGAGNGKDETS